MIVPNRCWNNVKFTSCSNIVEERSYILNQYLAKVSSSDWKQLNNVKTSPPGLEPKVYGISFQCSDQKATKTHVLHIKVLSKGYTNIPDTPLPGCCLILNLMKAAYKL